MNTTATSSTADDLVAVNVCIIPPKSIVDLSLAACRDLCEPLKGTAHYYVLAPISSEDLSDTGACMDGAHQEGVSATPQHGIPHCTLYQLFAKRSDIPLLSSTVRDIVQSEVVKLRAAGSTSSSALLATCEGRLAPGPVFGKTEAGEDVHVPSIVITNTGAVKALHEAVVNGLRKFHHLGVAAGGVEVEKDEEENKRLQYYRSAFSHDWPASEASASWTLNFEKNAAFDKYFPHITLGSCVGKPEGDRLCLPALCQSLAQKGEPATFNLEDSAIVVSEMANNCCCYKVLSVVKI